MNNLFYSGYSPPDKKNETCNILTLCDTALPNHNFDPDDFFEYLKLLIILATCIHTGNIDAILIYILDMPEVRHFLKK